MSDRMNPIPFGKMMDRIIEEYKTTNGIFNVTNLYRPNSDRKLEIFGGKIENPFGPAAGPHTQLAHNLVAAYVGGSRFFELKTVQILDGEDLHVEKPCIRADDECYNVEWSTELYVPQALSEYIKGWYAIKLIAKEYNFGDPDGFIFNMSVGYNLEGIKSEKIDNFINKMRDAKDTQIWKECEEWALSNLDKFENVDEEYVKNISSKVCNCITLSTMHGCPKDEIESIIRYLLEEKNIHTYLKCNPTLLGYDFVRELLDKMGYDYMQFERSAFEHDLQYPDAVKLLTNMKNLADEKGLEFGVKLSNTFHVKITDGQLPGEDMYMSGKALYPLTINLAAKLSKEFDGQLPISFSGGADANNIQDIFNTGIWPITVATVLLKPSGYQLVSKLSRLLEDCQYPNDKKVDAEKVGKLAAEVSANVKYCKSETAKKKPLADFNNRGQCGFACKVTCGGCVNICPNRANTTVTVGATKRMLHLDSLCNECGNCYIFCVDKVAPYKDRMTLFANKEDFAQSSNMGFAADENQFLWRYEGQTGDCFDTAPEIIKEYYNAVKEQCGYLL